MVFQGEKDDKIIAVCADDPEYKHYSDIRELAPHRLSEIRRFFEDCILFGTIKLSAQFQINEHINFKSIYIINMHKKDEFWLL